jgi:ribosomal subunit interface protein
MEVDDNLTKYIGRKIGRLDKYIPEVNRDSVHALVTLKEINARDKNERLCEVVLYVPQETLTVKEATVNMYAAIDIVEAKLRQQLRKYKSLHANSRLHQRLIAKLKHLRS